MSYYLNNTSYSIWLFWLLMFFTSCRSEDSLFRLVPAEESGIDFRNEVAENDSTNILAYEYAYNGGGVAVADFNNDGLQDIYFVGNAVANRLYLNKGKMKFMDVTSASGVAGTSQKWYGGVTVVDINSDGWPDIYLSVTRSGDPQLRKNELYVNQKPNDNGVPVFEETAAAYRLDSQAYSTHAGFLDYDNDGDLDMYELVAAKKPKKDKRTRKHPGADGTANRDRLYQNTWSNNLGHPVYKDVSEEAGITKEGFGLGFNIVDMNGDGWKDVYVSNDYLSEDLFWINNGDGTFVDRADEYFKHTSFSGMGTDIQDLNNDGLADIITLDMAPEGNLRRQTMTSPNNYRNYFRKAFADFQPQYTRNTLQLNRGGSVVAGHPVFSEIAFLSGIAFTDWSWAPLVADFDQDGFRDIIITNGIVKDKTDRDFVAFRNDVGNVAPQSMLLNVIPELKISNYVFKNNGDLTFADVSESWGLKRPSFSTGGAWADLDNDGDLDIVVNNINQEAFLYENTANGGRRDSKNHWFKVDFKGKKQNMQGLGARVEIFYDGDKSQVYENTPYRGYLSTVQAGAYFGLGNTAVIDSISVRWPDGKWQQWEKVKADQVFIVDVSDTTAFSNPPGGFRSLRDQASLFTDVTNALNVDDYIHDEKNFNDFRFQRLLPHKLSQYGPALAVGDVDGNGTQDIVVGGSLGNNATLLLQQQNGSFTFRKFRDGVPGLNKVQEDRGMLLFDADSDRDLDLYIVSGSVEHPSKSAAYQDRLYENDGKGNFTYLADALPRFYVSGSAVKAADYDRDGDLDLLVGGRVSPGRYPEPVSSYLLRNDTAAGQIRFTDVTKSVAPELQDIGMITDALWTDFNTDGWQDLILTGEWMPVTFLENRRGRFKNITETAGINSHTGWWNSITAGDYDNDGDTDYIAGNLGLNSFYQATHDRPVRIYASDFEGNGIYTAIPTVYLPDANGILKEFPAHSRDDLASQLPEIKRQFPRYKEFGRATISDVLAIGTPDKTLIHEANELRSSYIENHGDGTFSIRPMPMAAQYAPVFGMITGDFDGDSNLDVILNGNEFGGEVQVGQYDASNGLMLAGRGNGTFVSKSIAESGIYIPGDGKALVKLRGVNDRLLVVASQNSGPLRVFEKKQKVQQLSVNPTDVYAVINFTNGKKRRREFYYGSSFLSASGRFLAVTPDITSIKIVDAFGNQRIIGTELVDIGSSMSESNQ